MRSCVLPKRSIFVIFVCAYILTILIIYSKVKTMLPGVRSRYTPFSNKSHFNNIHGETNYNIIIFKGYDKSFTKAHEVKRTTSIMESKPSLVLSETQKMNDPVFRKESNNSSYVNETTMIFDRNIVVHCKKSPFIECAPSLSREVVTKNTIASSRTYNITFFRRPFWIPTSYINFTGCRFNQCMYALGDDDTIGNVVLIYGVGLKDEFIPKKRVRHQLYVLSMWESPYHTRSDYANNSVWNNQFNLTMSYRVDSDIFIPYGKLRFQPKPLSARPNYYEIAKNKTKMIIWIVSNCRTPSKREEYVKMMREYIDVDIYGGCGTPCPEIEPCIDISAYRFYLSFENSLCRDYVSEKFLKLFVPGHHIIPVVRGAADYDKYFQRFTYINTADFHTPRDLALFLKVLAGDLIGYSKYLEYKELYEITGAEFSDMGCALCQYLHTHRIRHTVYDLKKWLLSGQCQKPGDVFVSHE